MHGANQIKSTAAAMQCNESMQCILNVAPPKIATTISDGPSQLQVELRCPSDVLWLVGHAFYPIWGGPPDFLYYQAYKTQHMPYFIKKPETQGHLI